MINTPRFAISPRSRSRAQGLVFVATMVAIFGACYAPQRAWPNLLLNGFYITSLAVSAVFFLATQRLAGARWSAPTCATACGCRSSWTRHPDPKSVRRGCHCERNSDRSTPGRHRDPRL